VPEDVTKVEAVRRIIEVGVDWPCEVLKNYAADNMGCRERAASGISWAFSLFEEAIFLEDDCLPHQTFFTFCETMLQRFRDDERIMHVNGTNFIAPHRRGDESYLFSKYVWVWGWASWRRAWQHYDFKMSSWDERKRLLYRSFDSRRERAFWVSAFEAARRDWSAAQTWAFPWIYSCWTRGGYTVVPACNLVENLGFGSDATHTVNASSHLRIRADDLQIVNHPDRISRSRLRDDKMFRAYAGESLNWCNNLTGALRVFHRQCVGPAE